MNNDRSIGETIRYYRERVKWSQEKLARALNTSKQTISRYERGQSYLPVEAIKTLCIAFNITPNDFLGVPEEVINDDKAMLFNKIYERITKLNNEEIYLVMNLINILRRDS